MDDAGSPAGSPFDAEQRDFWEAIAMWRSGTAPETSVVGRRREFVSRLVPKW